MLESVKGRRWSAQRGMPRPESIDSLSRRPDGTRNDVELRRDEEVRLPVRNDDGLIAGGTRREWSNVSLRGGRARW